MKIDFEKANGLVPAIIQDAVTKNVLMLGYMNKEAYEKTIATGKVTFWSRSRNCLWTKGETSGNYLHLVNIQNDCDNDTLLVKVHPSGPTCHTGTDTCGDRHVRFPGANGAVQDKVLSAADKCHGFKIRPRHGWRYRDMAIVIYHGSNL